jgi:hypothetical protein
VRCDPRSSLVALRRSAWIRLRRRLRRASKSETPHRGKPRPRHRSEMIAPAGGLRSRRSDDRGIRITAYMFGKWVRDLKSSLRNPDSSYPPFFDVACVSRYRSPPWSRKHRTENARSNIAQHGAAPIQPAKGDPGRCRALGICAACRAKLPAWPQRPKSRNLHASARARRRRAARWHAQGAFASIAVACSGGASG